MKRTGFAPRQQILQQRAKLKRVANPLKKGGLGERLTPKETKPWRCDVHKARVVACGCLVPRYSKAPTECWGPIDPHHVTLWRKGWGQPSDALLVPLCRGHHNEAHEGKGKERGFEERHGITFAQWIERFNAVGAAEIAKITAHAGQ